MRKSSCELTLEAIQILLPNRSLAGRMKAVCMTVLVSTLGMLSLFVQR